MATGPNASVVEAKLSGKLGVIGTSGPINADGGGPQRAKQASSSGFGRGGAICEYDEIMQILPGSSDDAVLINASRVICNIAVGVRIDRIETDSRFLV
jgi:hypothetical protein